MQFFFDYSLIILVGGKKIKSNSILFGDNFVVFNIKIKNITK